VVRANRIQTVLIILRSVAATLRITVATIYEVYRGTYERSRGDERLRWWSKRLLDLIDLHWRVFNPSGTRIQGATPTIIMSNHASLYDIPLLFVALPGSIRMLTKKELFRVPIWGRGLRVAEFIAIDRRDRRQAIEALDQARDKMSEGIIVWVAPEGTRSRDGRLGTFKKGGFMLALQTGATIIPVGIRGSHEILPAKTLELWLGQHAEVHIGSPIDASQFSLASREDLMTLVRERISTLAGTEDESTDGARPGAEVAKNSN